MSEDKKLTTATGCPIFENQNFVTVGPRGQILMQLARQSSAGKRLN